MSECEFILHLTMGEIFSLPFSRLFFKKEKRKTLRKWHRVVVDNLFLLPNEEKDMTLGEWHREAMKFGSSNKTWRKS